jgi:hypothetical protein
MRAAMNVTVPKIRCSRERTSEYRHLGVQMKPTDFATAPLRVIICPAPPVQRAWQSIFRAVDCQAAT